MAVWGALIPLIGSVLEKVLPDPTQAADAKLKMLELVQKGELALLEADVALARGQMEINKAEAQTDNFRGGWRPAAGWVCVSGLGYQFLLKPLLPWVFLVFGMELPPLPPIDNESLMVLLTGMLGLGGFRSYDKSKGKA